MRRVNSVSIQIQIDLARVRFLIEYVPTIVLLCSPCALVARILVLLALSHLLLRVDVLAHVVCELVLGEVGGGDIRHVLQVVTVEDARDVL